MINRILKIKRNEEIEPIAGMTKDGWKMCVFANYPFEAGESYFFLSSGGGGWGNPLDRPPEKVLEDVLNEYISVKDAERAYGVAIDPKELTIDYEATKKLRDDLKNDPEKRRRYLAYVNGPRSEEY